MSDLERGSRSKRKASMEKQEPPEFIIKKRPKVTCRICLKIEFPTCFLPVDAQTLDGKTIAEKIYEISDVMVTLDKHLSQLVCSPCVERLELAYQLRKLIIASNAALIQAHNDSIPKEELQMHIVKEEPTVDFGDDSTTVYEVEQIDSDSMDTSDHSSRNEQSAETQMGWTKKKKHKKRTLCKIAKESILNKDGLFHCMIDKLSPCTYIQKRFEQGNFIRHFRLMHRNLAIEKGLFQGMDVQPIVNPLSKKKRIQAKIDNRAILEACVRLVTVHNLPLGCFEWPAFEVLLNPLREATAVPITTKTIKIYLNSAAKHTVEELKKELSDQLVSIKIDSVCFNNRQIFVVGAQYEQMCNIVSRTLDFIEVQPNQSCKNLLVNLQSVFIRFGLSTAQIYAIVWDETASMFISNRKLRKLCVSSLLMAGVLDEGNNNQALLSQESAETLYAGLSEHYMTVRGAMHYLDEAMSRVLTDDDPNMVIIGDFIQDLRDSMDVGIVNSRKLRLPTRWSRLQWYDKCKTIHFLVKQETFLLTLSSIFPELAFETSTLQLMRDFEIAFQPIRSMIKKVQKGPQPFCEFYMQKVLVIKDLRGLANNPFSKPLVESLTKLLTTFKENMLWNACLYLDPRFNYIQSVVFTPEQKEAIQSFIIRVWNQWIRLKPSRAGTTSTVPASDDKDDMEDFFSEMFGNTPGKSKKDPIDANYSMLQQLKALEIETRQPCSYDVVHHWVRRKVSHPDLATVALVILATPTSHVSLQTACAPFLVSNQNFAECSAGTLKDIITLKQNQQMLEKILPSVSDCEETDDK